MIESLSPVQFFSGVEQMVRCYKSLIMFLIGVSLLSISPTNVFAEAPKKEKQDAEEAAKQED